MEGVMEIRVFSMFLLLSVGGFRLALTETQALPSNVTQVVGTNVVLQCVGAAISSSNTPISWMKDRKRTVVYNGQTQANSDSNKYSVGSNGNSGNNGSNSLTVMNVQLSDATMYCCNNGLDDYCSNVVVIASVTASVDPSNGVAVGDDVFFTCTLSYNAPPTDVDYPFPLSPDQDPQLTMWIGQNQIPKDMTGELIVGNPTVPHSKTLSYNKTVAREDVGQNLTCVVSSTSPQLQNATGTPIPVNMPTHLAEIRYPNGSRNPDNIYPLNSTFKCVGDGFPVPNVDWLDGNDNNRSVGKKDKGSAIWTASSHGTHKLICSAQNSLSRNATLNDTTVIVNGEVTSEQKTGDNKVGLGVGLGIGLGVPILLGLIILIVILTRRKKKNSEPYPVKQPETKAKSASTGKSPNGKNGTIAAADPTAGPRNNVNPNPNPTYTTPVMPEQTSNNPAQRNVRDSPGYGDLGVRHIGGSGSNPHLNESFDSKADASFDSSRNHSAGGNIAFKPGRTSQSPSAPNTSV